LAVRRVQTTMDWPHVNQALHPMPVKVHVNPNFRGKLSYSDIQGSSGRPAGIHFNPHWKPKSGVDSFNTIATENDTPTSSLPPSQRRTIHINPKVTLKEVSQTISTLLQQELSSDTNPLHTFQDSVEQKPILCESKQRCAVALSSNLVNNDVNLSTKTNRLMNSPSQLYRIQRNLNCVKSPAMRSAKIVCSKYKYLNTSITPNLTQQHLHPLRNRHPTTKPASSFSRFKYVKKSPDIRKPGLSPKNHIVSQFKLVKRAPASMSMTLTPRRMKTQKNLGYVKSMPEHSLKSRYRLSEGIMPKPIIGSKNRSLLSAGKCKTNSRYKFVRAAQLQRTPPKRKSPRALKTRFKVVRGTGNEASQFKSTFNWPSRLKHKSVTYEASSSFARCHKWLRQDLQATKFVTSNRKLMRM